MMIADGKKKKKKKDQFGKFELFIHGQITTDSILIFSLVLWGPVQELHL
jgi:hypothetical protein